MREKAFFRIVTIMLVASVIGVLTVCGCVKTQPRFLFFTPDGRDLQGVLGPIVSGLKTDYEGRVQFETVNCSTPEGKELKAKYDVISLPNFVLLDAHGKIVPISEDDVADIYPYQDTPTFRKSYTKYLKVKLDKIVNSGKAVQGSTP